MKTQKRIKARHLHGVQPCKCLAIRWLGAYTVRAPLATSVEWEKNSTHMVAVEILQRRMESDIRSKVGLLVDQDRSTLIKAFQGDAFTEASPKDPTVLIERRNGLSFVRSWGEAGGLAGIAMRRKRNDTYLKGYVEGVVRSPTYKAIVIKDDKPSTLDAANVASEITGLPIVSFASLSYTD